ncbi:ACP S-malonyltransferase [Lentzea sp. NBRC 102530]|uniref:ACP S-malonyltransferase n=1 Tax=Lentzea sp. NBRC 102530 TaxID=3032201 RepID=UPI002553E6F6|nr:ACP S-malonyltransferase [Lentzea sp. NBRC 102530]
MEENQNTTTEAEQGRTAIVFPGMGPSSFADVGRYMVLDRYARRRLAAADEALGYSVLERFRGADDEYSEATQIAFLINSVALADRAVDVMGLSPDVCVGPSFGQKAATAFVGSLPFADVVRMTAELARCEEEFFSTQYSDVVTQSFVRAPKERTMEILAEMEARGEWHEISGFLDSDFYFVSVRESFLDDFKQRIRAAGGYSMYSMRPPVHARAFGDLRRKAEDEVFSRYEVAAPRMPVIADQNGAVVTSADDMRTMLLDTFDQPINWPDVVSGLQAEGVSELWFTGADNLFHRLHCTTKNFRVTAVTPKTALKPAKKS